MSSRSTVVIVEDNYLIAEDLRALCEEFGTEVVAVTHGAEEALSKILDLKPDFVLLDVRLGGKRDGVDVAKKVHDDAPEIRIVFVTGSNEPPTIDRIETDDPHRILIKPISPSDLRDALQSKDQT